MLDVFKSKWMLVVGIVCILAFLWIKSMFVKNIELEIEIENIVQQVEKKEVIQSQKIEVQKSVSAKKEDVIATQSKLQTLTIQRDEKIQKDTDENCQC